MPGRSPALDAGVRAGLADGTSGDRVGDVGRAAVARRVGAGAPATAPPALGDDQTVIFVPPRSTPPRSRS